jgi:hypothetical protein
LVSRTLYKVHQLQKNYTSTAGNWSTADNINRNAFTKRLNEQRKLKYLAKLKNKRKLKNTFLSLSARNWLNLFMKWSSSALTKHWLNWSGNVNSS